MLQFDCMHLQIIQGTCSTKLNRKKIMIQIGECHVEIRQLGMHQSQKFWYWRMPIANEFCFAIVCSPIGGYTVRNLTIGEKLVDIRQLVKMELAKTKIGESKIPRHKKHKNKKFARHDLESNDEIENTRLKILTKEIIRKV